MKMCYILTLLQNVCQLIMQKNQPQTFGKLQFLQADILSLLLDLVQDLEFALWSPGWSGSQGRLVKGG